MQLDEFWGFVFKKQYNLSESEKLSDEIGDMWTFTAINPINKLILAHVLGKRTKINAIKLVSQAKTRCLQDNSDTIFITSDGFKDYVDAIRAVYGKLNSETKDIELPVNLCYAQVIKAIKKGKCKQVDKVLVFGDQDLLDNCLKTSPVSHSINTSYVERSNFTLRQHNHRIERKSQGFSKKIEYMVGHNSLSIAYYNFCLPHSSLLKYQDSAPIHTTPAMAAKITDPYLVYGRVTCSSKKL